MNITTKEIASCKARCRVIDKNGNIGKWGKWVNNLLLDVGLNGLGVWAESINSLQRGTDSTPTRKDTASTGVTLTQAANVVTANGNFFVSTDVGALLKYDAGSAGVETYITGYIDSQNVTVDTSSIVAATSGVVWYVNQPGCIAPLDSTGGNGFYSAPVWSFQNASLPPSVNWLLSFQFPAVGRNVTITELGLISSYYGAPNLSRVLLPGGGIPLTTGQVLQTQYSFTVAMPDGSAQVSNPDLIHPSGDPFNCSGTFIRECQGMGNMVGDGATTPLALDPRPGDIYSRSLGILTSNWAQRAICSSAGVRIANIRSSATYEPYVTNSFKQSRTASWGLQGVDTLVYGVSIGTSDNELTVGSTLKFNTPQLWLSTHSLSFTCTVSWGRILTN